MHVGEPSDQWLLASHMYVRCGFEMPQMARVGVMVYRQNVENASFVLVNRLCVRYSYTSNDFFVKYSDAVVSIPDMTAWHSGLLYDC